MRSQPVQVQNGSKKIANGYFDEIDEFEFMKQENMKISRMTELEKSSLSKLLNPAKP